MLGLDTGSILFTGLMGAILWGMIHWLSSSRLVRMVWSDVLAMTSLSSGWGCAQSDMVAGLSVVTWHARGVLRAWKYMVVLRLYVRLSG